MGGADTDLAGSNLQKFVARTLKSLVDQLWPTDVRGVIAYVESEVVDHGRGLVTVARLHNSFAVKSGQFRWPPVDSQPVPYERIKTRTPEAVTALLTEHLNELLPMLRDAIGQRSR